MRERTSDDGSIVVGLHAGALQDLEPAWQRLVEPKSLGAPFRTYAWVSSWWTHVSTSKEPQVMVARRDGDIVGILPAYVERTRLGGRRLRLMGDGIVGSDWLGAIARPAHLQPVSRAFAAHLHEAGCDEVQLDDLAPDDPLIRAVGGKVEPRFKCPCIRIAGSFDEYLERLPDGIGAQLHRRRRWLERRPGYAIEELTRPADVERGMRVLFELHRRRWALEGGSDAIDSEAVERFHVEAARMLAQKGWARLWLLHADGAPRAALYGFRHGDRLAYYQSGHEPEWRPRSVGTVLLGHVIATAFAQRLTEFDFLRGEEPYKLRWATGMRETVRLRARTGGLLPLVEEHLRLGWTLMKDAARAALPPATFARLQAWRKQLGRGAA
jgi:CelD/BcsL family acetyltransferase involved in cellulose biosynthesis